MRRGGGDGRSLTATARNNDAVRDDNVGGDFDSFCHDQGVTIEKFK